ncbi:hypothetical protein [Wolbachia endosymbiont of Dactylopius coccus]
MFIWLNCHFFSPSSYFLSTEPRFTDDLINDKFVIPLLVSGI